MPDYGVNEILIAGALYIAASVGLNGSTDDEELDTLDELGHRPGIVSATTEVTGVETRHTPGMKTAEEPSMELKRDLFGTIRYEAHGDGDGDGERIIRETADAPPWARPLARFLARREARTLLRLAGHPACPQLIEQTPERVIRSFLPGQVLHAARFDARQYFRDALRQLRRIHARRITHNDLAKEANWICMPDNRAGIVDFQIALRFKRRNRLFRTLAREDLRHLLKHKQHYAAGLLTQRQRAILARPLWPARVWRACCKPIYRFITRRILGWPERNSAVERSI